MFVVALVVLVTAVPVLPARAGTATLSWPDHPAPASTAASLPCADVLVVGSRGSLEEGPYGTTVRAWRDAIASATASDAGAPDTPARSGRVRELYVDYPALAPDSMLQAGIGPLLFGVEMPATPYLSSVEDGVTALTTALDDSARRCPAERWVLVGYSQGAQVVNEALAVRGELRSRQLLLALLFGNPGHYQGQSVTEPTAGAASTASGLTAAMYYIRQAAAAGRAAGGEDRATADGVRAVLEVSQGKAGAGVLAAAQAANRLAIPPGLQRRVLSLCNAEDMVCDAGPAIQRVVVNGGSTDAEIARAAGFHAAYRPTDAPSVLDRVVAEVRAVVPVRPPPSTPVPVPGGRSPGAAIIVGTVVVTLSLAAATAIALVQLGRRRRPS